tara:strand:- start:812 stop:928 length:117 start_codon:yes stop_codon:yes gene_type:complete
MSKKKKYSINLVSGKKSTKGGKGTKGGRKKPKKSKGGK